MKKVLLKISILTMAFIVFCLYSHVYAGEASLSASGDEVGGTVSVSVSMPSDAYNAYLLLSGQPSADWLAGPASRKRMGMLQQVLHLL